MITRNEIPSIKIGKNLLDKTYAVTKNSKLTPEEKNEYDQLFQQQKQYNDALISENPSEIITAALFYTKLFSFHCPDPSFTNKDMLTNLSSLVFLADDINYQTVLMEALIAFLRLSGYKLGLDLNQQILERIQSISPPVDQFLHYLTLLFTLLSFIIKQNTDFQLSNELIEKCAIFIGLSEELDIMLTKCLIKCTKNEFDEQLIPALIEYSKYASESPFFQSNASKLMKLLLICAKNSSEKELFDQNSDLIVKFSAFWGLSEDTDALLFFVTERIRTAEFFKHMLEQGGYDAIIRTFQTGNEKLMSAAFSLLSSFDFENWVCPISIVDLLGMIVPIIFEGSIRLKWQAGKFMGNLAEIKPEYFYQTFLEANEEDSDDDPDPTNYARAFGFMIQLADDDKSNENIIPVIDGMYSIGEYFNIKDQLHEFKETLDFYLISDYMVNLLSESDNKDIVETAEMFYSTFVTFMFSIDK